MGKKVDDTPWFENGEWWQLRISESGATVKVKIDSWEEL